MQDQTTFTILFCEDDDAVRCVTRRILQRAGYEVIAVTTGANALEILKEDPLRIDLLMTDVVMPSMNGPELAAAARLVNSELTILFVSGFAAQHLDVVEQFGERAAFLPKPYASASLIELVAYLLKGQ